MESFVPVFLLSLCQGRSPMQRVAFLRWCWPLLANESLQDSSKERTHKAEVKFALFWASKIEAEGKENCSWRWSMENGPVNYLPHLPWIHLHYEENMLRAAQYSPPCLLSCCRGQRQHSYSHRQLLNQDHIKYRQDRLHVYHCHLGISPTLT